MSPDDLARFSELHAEIARLHHELAKALDRIAWLEQRYKRLLDAELPRPNRGGD